MMAGFWVITGGSRGLGAALMRRVAADGDAALSVSRGAPPVGEHLQCDLRDPVACADALEGRLSKQATEGIGLIVLVNNAGTVQPIGDSYSTEEAARSLAVNVVAPVAITRVFLRTFESLRARKIVVNISSGAAVNAHAGMSLYCAAKAAIEHFGRAVAAEQRRLEAPADVVNVTPGIMDTDMQAEVRSASRSDFPEVDRFISYFERGELVPPELVADRLVRGIRSRRRYGGATVDATRM